MQTFTNENGDERNQKQFMKVCVSFQNRTACDDEKTSSRIPYQFEFLKYPVTSLSNNQFVVMQFSEPQNLILILLCHKVNFFCPSYYTPFFIRDNFWVQPQNFFNKNKLSLEQFLITNRFDEAQFFLFFIK